MPDAVHCGVSIPVASASLLRNVGHPAVVGRQESVTSRAQLPCVLRLRLKGGERLGGCQAVDTLFRTKVEKTELAGAAAGLLLRSPHPAPPKFVAAIFGSRRAASHRHRPGRFTVLTSSSTRFCNLALPSPSPRLPFSPCSSAPRRTGKIKRAEQKVCWSAYLAGSRIPPVYAL